MAPRSLRAELLAWLVLPLLCVAVFNAWTGYMAASETADLITDRTLLASARVIAEQVTFSDGVIEALIPPSALEMFSDDTPDRVVYRVVGPHQELEAGHPDLPLPPEAPRGMEPVAYDATFRAEPIRAVAVRQPVVGPDGSVYVLVVVGESVHGHDELLASLWRKNLVGQALLVAAAGSLALLGLQRGLAPLRRLRGEIEGRDPSALSPIDVRLVQVELRPAVLALNAALARVEKQVSLQKRFVANAAHQLRTPLALLKTQARVGLREPAAAAKDEALSGIEAGLDSLTRMATQLLTLARAEQGTAELRWAEVDLVAVARHVTGRFAGAAVQHRIDLGLEEGGETVAIAGDEALLQEMLGNLIDNALQHAPSCDRVTVSVQVRAGAAVVAVEDNGPGIPCDERPRVFERFHRVLAAGGDPGGSGLGLAIVREIATAHGGTVTLGDAAAQADAVLGPGQAGPGLRVEVCLPLAVSSSRAAAPDATAPGDVRCAS